MNKRKFERDPDNKIIAGVCGGLARYFNVNSKIVRFIVFISLFLSFSLSFWLYILAWLITPMRRSTRENLSRDMRKKARNLDRLIEETQAKLSVPGLSARLANVQELIEPFLPELDSRSRERDTKLQPLYEAALVHLPALLENYLRLPSGYARGELVSGGKTSQDQLSEGLQKLERSLANATKERYGEKFAKTADALDSLQAQFEDDPTLPFRQKLESLQSRSSGRLDADAQAKIESIKNSLIAALGRLAQSVDQTDPNLYNVKQIALEYLPNTVDKYLALPQGVAETAEMSQGKTAKAALHEQLDVLDGALNRLVASLYQEDAQGLFVHGHFLRDKFLDQQTDWLAQQK